MDTKNFFLKYIKSVLLILILCFLIVQANAQVFIQRTSDSTFKFIGEFGLVTGSYTYDQFAPDFYLEGFKFQLKKGIYYRLENERNSFRLSFLTSSGKINHEAKQYYEIKDTINLNGHWKNYGIQIGFELNLFQQKNFTFYTGTDAVYRSHKFTGTGSSMFNENNFQQKINSFGIGTELFFGARFSIKQKFKIGIESAFSVLNINEHGTRYFSNATLKTGVTSSRHLSVEPSPFNRISLGFKF